ncbi:hypothetical protein CRG98_004560 [Punica granatum]|uniref:Uncharacterized protein n=1 Tax=Punica granatum TaxID=22663 RepID=A0A2I0L4M0_PUNGR|nr:hypothetical protein CRG98_004560 [Punica granatum]
MSRPKRSKGRTPPFTPEGKGETTNLIAIIFPKPVSPPARSTGTITAIDDLKQRSNGLVIVGRTKGSMVACTKLMLFCSRSPMAAGASNDLDVGDGGSKCNSIRFDIIAYQPRSRGETEHRRCAHPNFVSSGHACARLNATRLRSVHLPGDTRRTHVRKSRHYMFTTRRSRADNLVCWGVGRTGPKGWTGPTGTNWAELGRWLLDWTTGPGPNCWADSLDFHRLGARIGLLDNVCSTRKSRQTRLEKKNTKNKEKGRGGPSDGGDWPGFPTSRGSGGLLRNRVRDSVRIRTEEDKNRGVRAGGTAGAGGRETRAVGCFFWRGQAVGGAEGLGDELVFSIRAEGEIPDCRHLNPG